MDIRKTPIEPDHFYHIYNRGVNGEVIFKSERNFHFFLNKIKEKLIPVCDIYAYCLMSNHFHLLVKIKSDSELKKLVKQSTTNPDKGLYAAQNVFSKHFSTLFNSYSQAFNKENKRHGPLIESPFKRKWISSEKYLRDCIIYIHKNPQYIDFRAYSFSSYQTILAESNTFLKREEVIDLFDTKENFVVCHLF
ncbi:MAG: transposase [Weeksellaceae bacterium]